MPTAANVRCARSVEERRWRHAHRQIQLVGAGGEPVELRRTIDSHGVADLPPNRIDEEAWTLELTLPVDGKAPTESRRLEGRKGYASIQALVGRRDPGRSSRCGRRTC